MTRVCSPMRLGTIWMREWAMTACESPEASVACSPGHGQIDESHGFRIEQGYTSNQAT
jgi:hypothetical protein